MNVWGSDWGNPSRRQGGLARALLVAGALAGLMLGTVAQAQIAFRGSASAGIASTGDITYGGSGTTAVRTSCGSINPGLPAGTAAGDFLLASVVSREERATITMPGWNTLFAQIPAGVSNYQVVLFWRIATGGDPNTITQAGTCGSLFARISRFTGVDTTDPILNAPAGTQIPGANWSFQNQAYIRTGTETTAVPNMMLVMAAFTRDDSTVAAPPAGCAGATAFTTLTQAFVNANTSGGDSSIWLYYGLQTTAGAKGPYCQGKTVGSDANHGVLFALRPTGLRINVPAGTVAGDVMVASIAVQPSGIAITAPAGWTLVRNNAQAAGSSSRMATYYRVATAGEPASYLWTFSGAASTGAAGGIISFSGVNNATPIDAEGGNTTPSALTHTANAISAVSGGTMLVGSFEFTSTPSAANWTSNMTTNQVNQGSIAGPSNAGIRLLMAYETRPATGSTGTRTATANGVTADTGLAYLLALQPAVVVVPLPGSFNAFETSTGAGAIAGQVYTKLVGTNFTLDVVAILTGAQHATFTNTVQVDLVTGSTGGANCPGTPVAIAGTSQNVNLTNGRGTTGVFNTASAYPDVRVRVSYPVASPTVTACSTDNFTIRPVTFSAPVSSDMTNTGSSGVPMKKAGDAFSLSVSGGTGYTGTPSIDSTKITAHAGAIQTGVLAGGFGAAAGGTASGAAFTYSEVGNFTVGINGVYDDAFTNASADKGNGDCTLDFSNALVGGRYGCSFGNSAASAAIGRFTPDHFDVALNAPVFTPACGSFTYVGQGFTYSTAPVVTVTARNSAGLGNAVTRNYTGVWQKLTSTSMTYPGGAAKGYRAFTGTLDVTSAPNNPTITPGGAGLEGTVTLGFSAAAPGLFFQRAAAVAPFDADISLAINVIDEDAVAYASNPAKFGNEVAGGGMVFSDLNALTTNDKSMRFGRLQLGAGGGSHLVALSLPVEAQYWNGTAFVTNAADNCTTLGAANVGLGNFVGLASGDTTPSISGAFSSGRKNLTLSPPGGSKLGTVDVVINLSATAGAFSSCTTFAPAPTPTAANLAHLRGRWCGPSPNYDRDATARARFGVYRGAEEVIFVRENY